MKSFLIIASILLVATNIAILGPLIGPSAQLGTSIAKNLSVVDLEVPIIETLAKDISKIKLAAAKRTITLESKNMLVLKGPVTEQSVARLQNQLLRMRHRLKDSDIIYLVLDTPGGSVFAGMRLIDHLRAVPQKIHTITLFAASMGFHIVQNMDKRYITKVGTLMSHRARGGLRGQFDGEFETRYRMTKRALTYLDSVAAKRLKISLKKYKALIKDEYWAFGFDAPTQNAADETIQLNCGKSLRGRKTVNLRTMFGTVSALFSKCPLIRGPIGLDFSRIKKAKLKAVKKVIKTLLTHERKYVEDFILTNKHFKYFSY